MFGPVRRYIRWLHTQWPAGTVEKLPLVNEDGSTNVQGLYIVGDLTGIPLLKFSSDTGARAVQTIAGESSFQSRDRDEPAVFDVAIIGGGVSGVAAAAEARSQGLSAVLIEAAEPFSTVANFPKGKPIYTYPTDMTPAGELQFSERSDIKEGLLDELNDFMRDHEISPRIARVQRVIRRGAVFDVEIVNEEPIRAHRVIVGIGRSGNHRTLGVPGEHRDIVYNRLHDPREFCGKNIIVVGGGDTALETAIALTSCGSRVTLSYRKSEFGRPKPENVDKITQLASQADADVDIEHPTSEFVSTATGHFVPDRAADDICEGCGKKLRGKPADGECPGCGHEFHRKVGSIKLMMASRAKEIRDDSIVITNSDGEDETIPAEAVFVMIGREAPLDFFRRSGIRIRGEWKAWSYVSLALFFAFCLFIYHWKSDAGFGIKELFKKNELFPFNLVNPDNPANLFGTIWLSMQKPSFYYTLAYTTCIVLFGIRRIKRRRTPYVKVQTLTLMSIQVVPLFLLPFFLLPWMGHNGMFDTGVGRSIADSLFPVSEWDNHGREYWRSVGFVLAWPLLPWNFFTNTPMMAWLVIGCIQTFVIIPLMVWRWGKGAYCGWICSCGALAETMGDAHRHKMPHGPLWNRLNMIGQVFLLFASVLLIVRVVSWVTAAPATAQISSVTPDESSRQQIVEFERADKKPVGTPTQIVVNRVVVDVETGDRIPMDPRLGVGEIVQLRYSTSGIQETTSSVFMLGFHGKHVNWQDVAFPLNLLSYVWFVDLLWAGIFGVAFYFWFSGRVWCRFACPLAALMHIYARFSQFRIIAEKKKCISCNVCTSVCHQGIDVMSFANKGLPMEDPQCVRCSACVQSCPTGVLQFGRVDRKTGDVLSQDRLAASPILMAEVTVEGKRR